jgi:hypothetical protein
VAGGPTLKLKLKRASGHGARYAAFVKDLTASVGAALVEASEISGEVLRSHMRVDTGKMRSAVRESNRPVLRAGHVYAGVASVRALDAATATGSENPRIVHGYWFNVEFGRASHSQGDIMLKSENPATVLPLAMYRNKYPSLYTLVDDMGRAEGRRVGGGMFPARALRLTALLSEAYVKSAVADAVGEVASRHKLRKGGKEKK